MKKISIGDFVSSKNPNRNADLQKLYFAFLQKACIIAFESTWQPPAGEIDQRDFVRFHYRVDLLVYPA